MCVCACAKSVSMTCSCIGGLFLLFLHGPVGHLCTQMVFYFFTCTISFCHGNSTGMWVHCILFHFVLTPLTIDICRVVVTYIVFPSHFLFVFTWMTWLPKYCIEYHSLQEKHNSVVLLLPMDRRLTCASVNITVIKSTFELFKKTWQCTKKLAFASHTNCRHATVNMKDET